jgi:hypothetical protein
VTDYKGIREMKYYVEFVEINSRGNYWKPCGDRGVMIIDGRLSPENAHAIASAEAVKRGFVDYSITKADSLRDI